MLRTGREYLNALQDGRVVYVGAEQIRDVVAHPGFRGAAQTVASIYDLKFAHRDDMVVEDEEGAYSTYFLMPQTKADLEKRLRTHRRIADATYGLFGRSPDHVASLITGLAMEADALEKYAENVRAYHRDARQRDAFVTYAVLPNRGDGMGLRIVREKDDGVVIRGVKALATAAVLADEIWIGNLQPIGRDQEMESVTCVVACNAPGVQLWSRKAFAASAQSETEAPLTWRFDEGDAMVVFDDVKVDWSRVFVHRDPLRSSEIYIRTPAHALANHQASVRSCSKVRLLVGLANRIAPSTDSVRELLGRLAAFEGTLAALVEAQIHHGDAWPSGGLAPNRRYVYAALNWCQESFPVMIEALRELSGSGVFRFPATGDVIERFWGPTAPEQLRLFKLVWDLIGSEFAGRQQLYERFYAGPPFVVRGHNHREAPWAEFDAVVAGLLARGGND
jgi:4-hydroxyphenylacetate 3-monooxygenase